MSELTR